MTVLEATRLAKSYRTNGKTIHAVRDVSISVDAGEVLAVLGPNGAGKTTSLKMVTGLIRRDGGELSIEGGDPQSDRRVMARVGAVLEGNRNIYWRLSAEENVEYFGVLKGMRCGPARRRAHELVARFGLEEKIGIPAQKLSRGMQQQVALAIAMVHEPKLLLLDEPTLGLDVRAAERMKTIVGELAGNGHAIVLSTHQMELAEEIADRVAIIHDGRIVEQGPTRELLRRFSGQAYRIELGGRIHGFDLRRLEEAGAVLKESRVELIGDDEQLYRVLEVIRPAPILKIEKVEASLTEVFLKLTQDVNYDDTERTDVQLVS